METDLIDLVTGQSHVFSNYAMSFLLAAVFWIIHHQQSHVIKRTDRNHIWLNILMLMFVSLIPFSTSLINDYHDDWMASIFFGMNMFILGSLFYVNWDYATRGHRLVALNLDPRRIAVGKRRSAVTPIVSLLAMALALVDAPVSSLAYLLIPVVLFHPTFRYNPKRPRFRLAFSGSGRFARQPSFDGLRGLDRISCSASQVEDRGRTMLSPRSRLSEF